MENLSLAKIRQKFDGIYIKNIEEKVEEEFKNCGVKIKNNSKIAIAVGSRGISNIHRIVKTIVNCIKKKGAYPFIIPAMGSHGGATPEGQRDVLKSYGVTEEYIGVPVKSSMETVELPKDNLKNRIFMDKYAYDADGTVVINRIKAHTDYHGPHESGLLKMCVIGLGKHKQAVEIHRHGVYGLKKLIPATARNVLKYGNIIMGIGIVENAYDQTRIIRAVKPCNLEQEDRKLLVFSKKHMPHLPVDNLDILIVTELGKNISGTGLDTNIIGRMKIQSENEPDNPAITRIIVTDITEESHGNALGMGLADFITKKMFDKINFKDTYENVLTSTFTERAKIPVIAENSRQAFDYALRTCGPVDILNARIIWIKNTLHIDEMYVSNPLLEEIKNNKDIEIISQQQNIFDNKGNLNEF